MNERINNILKSPWTIPIAVGVTSFGAGVGVGYYLARRKTFLVVEETVQQTFDFEIDEEDYERMNDIIDTSQYREVAAPVIVKGARAPETTAEIVGDAVVVRPSGPAAELIESHMHETILTGEDDDEDDEPVEPVVEINVFEQEDGDWDWEREVESREGKNEPYILHRDEFLRNENNFTQLTLTYYEGDDIMADDDDSMVYGHLLITGPLLFGHGSGDPNVVYIRNEERRAEYEVLRHEGRFEVEVLGLEIEDNEREKDLKHSKVSRFRME